MYHWQNRSLLVVNSRAIAFEMSLRVAKTLVLTIYGFLLVVSCQRAGDEWVDPYDMLNYDPATKTMRKAAEEVNYPNVPTKRRVESQDSCQEELASCTNYISDLRKQAENLKKKIATISQQPSQSPVFLRFLSRLLREIKRVGEPSDSREVSYDAAIRVSKQSLSELQTILDDKESRRTGALDDVLSQILVDLRPHDYEAWKWRFEDTFGLELDTLLKMALLVLTAVVVVYVTPWSVRSLFVMSFLVSIVWNWLYLYMIAFADHQKDMAKMSHEYEKCTGVKKIAWSDSLREWFRTTWTFQDDPCKKYYEVLMVNPILLVPPFKAISFTITTCFTEPLKHLGQGFSDFLRALLKDLPVTLQIPGFLAMLLCFLFFLYLFVTSAFKYGLTAPLRRGRRHQPPPEVEEPQERLQIKDQLSAGDASRVVAGDRRAQKTEVRHRRQAQTREATKPARVVVETLRTASSSYTDDETDGKRRPQEDDLSDPESGSDLENEPEELRGASGDCAEFKKNTQEEAKESDPSLSQKIKPLKCDGRKDRALSRSPAVRVREAPMKANIQAQDGNTSSTPSQVPVDTLGSPVVKK
ncbi:chloride channel CLIC-like protein 1 isoform X2 [Synchiropus splendidus]|uniref:chloride channel CLIC-like protein 1 isoform X2 n=1 Tax=Synchiropus splendidus TaxID=270530 RepID=UPI00237DFF39|nr:chloride channel CLIC-like protein 1 isoform X2 [Synchiropus splendidus]